VLLVSCAPVAFDNTLSHGHHYSWSRGYSYVCAPHFLWDSHPPLAAIDSMLSVCSKQTRRKPV